MAPTLPAGRSLSDTLRLVETVVWSLCTVAAAILLVASVVGAFVVSAQSVGTPAATVLAAVVVGTLVFLLADVVFE